ncbi:hypothetical protein M8997_005635 [Phyllobacterium sp. 21LDTY02-6]|uniref:hypothetical protein n=1 Tax=Phyllobacterium sp. 21LDTY02-6 TaxID=2944903 RepID=UPI002021182E|nr:hypothetical protein [Phyllobacterium sp. 21LDTY02-6]MCO4316657.1 hypothetical protein [Phyllobacterium sp. 21LDTY02-6]
MDMNFWSLMVRLWRARFRLGETTPAADALPLFSEFSLFYEAGAAGPAARTLVMLTFLEQVIEQIKNKYQSVNLAAIFVLSVHWRSLAENYGTNTPDKSGRSIDPDISWRQLPDQTCG